MKVNLDIKQWKHVFKLDPDKEISDEDLDRLCMSGTDAIMVGGSSGVTFDNTIDLLSRIRRYAVNCVLEISDHDAIVPGFDLYMIPVVLNTDDGQWITGLHQQAVKAYGSQLDWKQVLAEGYIMMNGQSTAAQVTGAKIPSGEKDLTAYATLADKLFSFPIVYIEYSGIYGNMEWVRKAADTLENSRLFYGGGITDREQAREASKAAHTIVVGNIIYENIDRALSTVLE